MCLLIRHSPTGPPQKRFDISCDLPSGSRLGSGLDARHFINPATVFRIYQESLAIRGRLSALAKKQLQE
jgi:hypothetical protein